MTNEELAVRIQTGETEYMSDLWSQVERFAVQQARKFFNKHSEACSVAGVDLDDLKQEVYLAIYKSAERLRVQKEVKFLTYAGYHLIDCFYSAAKLKRKQRIVEVGLDCPVSVFITGDVLSFADILSDPDAESKIEAIAEQDYNDKADVILREAIACLSSTQKEAISLCFSKGLTFAEAAKSRGVTRATVQQSVTRALKKLSQDKRLLAIG